VSDRPDKHREDEIARWIGDLPEAEADAGFRERLRGAFVSGEIDRAVPTPAAPVTRVHWWRWVPVAVAAVLVLLAIDMLNRGPVLQMADSSGSQPLTLDGRKVLPDDTEAMSRLLKPGATLEVPPDGRVDILARDVALYEVTGGSQLTLPATPGRWFGRDVHCTLYVGEIRLKTGRDFAGSQLTVYTPDGMIRVTGTMLSIQCDDGGTCVCVLEGKAMVGVNETDLEPVTPGYRKVMLRDGTNEIIPIKPMHRDGVLDFDHRVGDRIAHGK